MLRELLQFIIGQIALQTYWCDRCQQVELHWNKVGLIGYLSRFKIKEEPYLFINWPILQKWKIKYNRYCYCVNCWNYIHLAKGQCSICKTTWTLRTPLPKVFKTCEKDCILVELTRKEL